MGMDFRYAGSASYPRFDKEICNIAKIFGGKKTEYLKQLESEYVEANWAAQMFGTISANCAEDVVRPKFSFPDGTPLILIKFFNNPYDDFSTEETKELWNKIREHPEISEISQQIWLELELLVEFEEAWNIH